MFKFSSLLLLLFRVVVGRKKVKCLVIYWQDDTNPGAANQWKHINLINPSKGKLNDEHSCPVSKLYEKMMQVMRAEVYKIVELPKNPAPIQGRRGVTCVNITGLPRQALEGWGEGSLNEPC